MNTVSPVKTLNGYELHGANGLLIPLVFATLEDAERSIAASWLRQCHRDENADLR